MGLICVGIGGLGVFVPVLPTTIFLILASYFFTRSCPPLDAWLRSRPLFKPYRPYLDRTKPMPGHAIAWTLVLIWAALGFSGYRLRDGLSAWLLALIVIGLGTLASASVIWYGRGTRSSLTARQSHR